MPKYNDNERYMKDMKGGLGSKVMKNHGNTKAIDADNQDFDMKRMSKCPMEMKGHNKQAFDYKY
jgi:hypothetical protein